jgi:hypothetical protein
MSSNNKTFSDGNDEDDVGSNLLEKRKIKKKQNYEHKIPLDQYRMIVHDNQSLPSSYVSDIKPVKLPISKENLDSEFPVLSKANIIKYPVKYNNVKQLRRENQETKKEVNSLSKKEEENKSIPVENNIMSNQQSQLIEIELEKMNVDESNQKINVKDIDEEIRDNVSLSSSSSIRIDDTDDEDEQVDKGLEFPTDSILMGEERESVENLPVNDYDYISNDYQEYLKRHHEQKEKEDEQKEKEQKEDEQKEKEQKEDEQKEVQKCIEPMEPMESMESIDEDGKLNIHEDTEITPVIERSEKYIMDYSSKSNCGYSKSEKDLSTTEVTHENITINEELEAKFKNLKEPEPKAEDNIKAQEICKTLSSISNTTTLPTKNPQSILKCTTQGMLIPPQKDDVFHDVDIQDTKAIVTKTITTAEDKTIITLKETITSETTLSPEDLKILKENNETSKCACKCTIL